MEEKQHPQETKKRKLKDARERESGDNENEKDFLIPNSSWEQEPDESSTSAFSSAYDAWLIARIKPSNRIGEGEEDEAEADKEDIAEEAEKEDITEEPEPSSISRGERENEIKEDKDEDPEELELEPDAECDEDIKRHKKEDEEPEEQEINPDGIGGDSWFSNRVDQILEGYLLVYELDSKNLEMIKFQILKGMTFSRKQISYMVQNPIEWYVRVFAAPSHILPSIVYEIQQAPECDVNMKDALLQGQIAYSWTLFRDRDLKLPKKELDSS